MFRFSMVVVCAMIICGCGEKEEEAASLGAESVTPAAFNSAGSSTVEFSVPDMMCPDSCGEKTKEILAEQPGAKDVQINFEAKTATVIVEEGKFDAKQAIAALVDHGFDHSTLRSGAVAIPQQAADPTIQ